MPLAEETLGRLLARGERARVSGSQRVVRASFQDPSSDYWRQPLAERDRLHAVFERAASAGAVALAWAQQGGDDRPLASVALLDLDRLAAFLQVPTAATEAKRAEQVLSAWRQHPRVVELLVAWQQLRKVRGIGPEGASDFRDALRVLDSVVPIVEDRLARPLSVALFGNSKRIEALYPHLDLLTAESFTAPARHWSEVLGALGIRKEPQPFLIAGSGDLELACGPSIAIPRPFVGVASHAIVHYRGTPKWVLSVENLTTFHQCAELLAGADHGLVLYTGGMPSPSWVRGFHCILEGLAPGARLYHWGDHDEGGFRIAARVASVCSAAGRELLPWLMQVSEGARASGAQHSSMVAGARRAGWEALALTIPALLLEQELQLPALPSI